MSRARLADDRCKQLTCPAAPPGFFLASTDVSACRGVPNPPTQEGRTAQWLCWEETAELIERILAEEKHLFPNLDWPARRL
jgi:hypothetical protein